MSKVLLINGSPRENGNTFLALSEVAKTLNGEGIDTEIISIGKKAVQGCIACGMCGRTGKCTFNDDLYQRILRAVKEGIDGLVVGSPVYYGGPNGSLCALLDRVFYSLGPGLQYKPGASVVVCRRGGGMGVCRQGRNKVAGLHLCRKQYHRRCGLVYGEQFQWEHEQPRLRNASGEVQGDQRTGSVRYERQRMGVVC